MKGIMALLLLGLTATAVLAWPMDRAHDGDAYVASFHENDRPFMLHKLAAGQYGQRNRGDPERSQTRDAMQSAVESGDYDAWLEAAGDRPVTSVITEDNFGALAQIHRAREAGDFEAAGRLAEGLGIQGRGLYGRGRTRACAND
ncbi:MAG: hypothetical protein ABH879_06750 [archaeon]